MGPISKIDQLTLWHVSPLLRGNNGMKRRSDYFCRVRAYMVAILTLTTVFAGTNTPAGACTRAVYLGSENVVITGRSMDWAEDVFSNAWVFPRGMSREGNAGPNSVKWTSKY